MPAPQPGRLVPDEHRAVLVMDGLQIDFIVEPQPGDVITKDTPTEPRHATMVLNAGTRLLVENVTVTIPRVCTVATTVTVEGRAVVARFKMHDGLLKQIARPVMVPVGAGQGG